MSSCSTYVSFVQARQTVSKHRAPYVTQDEREVFGMACFLFTALTRIGPFLTRFDDRNLPNDIVKRQAEVWRLARRSPWRSSLVASELHDSDVTVVPVSR
jgi:hypothetical protein